MKKHLCLLAMCVPLLVIGPPFVFAQGDSINKGIHWTTGLTWEQVKQKAKAENKYIFLDCYATWCGPCKLMDKNVYTADSVAEFFNEKFISVKLQMDKTEKDDESVKNWYADADSINKLYHIEGYPTFLFFNPQGQVTENKSGFMTAGDFIAIGKSATVPGKLYNDPYEDYYKKIGAYKKGERNYDHYPFMIRFADKLRDTVLSTQLIKELTEYAAGLPPKERYTKERIEFWNNYTWLSNTKVFDYFYNDDDLIDKVMGKKKYAENFIDNTIRYEFVLPFLKEAAKGSNISLEGAYLTYSGAGNPTFANYNEADWGQLEKLIRAKFGKSNAKRNVLKARVEWYKRHFNKNGETVYTLKLLNYDRRAVKENYNPGSINSLAWDIFLSSTDKKILKGYAKWMKWVVGKHERWEFIDTYSNLLYKLGHKRKAMKWEEKAIKIAPNENGLSIALEQMRKGLPTYLDRGTIWNK